MKKYIRMLAILLSIALLTLVSCGKTKVKGDTATLYYIVGTANIQQILTEEEANKVIEIFDGKELYSKVPDCSFSESVSILIGGCFYQIATDNCGKVKESKSGKYFDISEDERIEIELIFASYGGFFPCE